MGYDLIVVGGGPAGMVMVEEQTVAEEFGEMLFTHYGISGPVIVSGMGG
ncbi:hypothetical protein [Desulfotruncus alcoholivorax]|nr:hypothetical protein [Desulfotruncus alcoholivorax]